MEKRRKEYFSISNIKRSGLSEEESDRISFERGLKGMENIAKMLKKEIMKKKIRNSIRAYVLGDCLGVPFEFQTEGTFKAELFKGYGTHNQPEGTWSDDTTVLLCLLDAFTHKDPIEAYKNNLKLWHFNDRFTINGCFDIGVQTSTAIRNNFVVPESDRMGNGALFYSLPLAILSQFIPVDFNQWCAITHNNKNCFFFGSRLMFILRELLQGVIPELKPVDCVKNQGDVINTYHLVINEFIRAWRSKTSLSEDLLRIISFGEDTDTNAALLGALVGTIKPVQEEDWNKVKENEYIDTIIDNFLDTFSEKEGKI